MEEMEDNFSRKETPTADCSAEQPSASADVSAQTAGNDSVKPSEAEPRRNRLKIFNKVMEKSLQRLCADARFAHSFHPLYKRSPQVTEVIHKQFTTDLQKAIQDDIRSVIEEGELQCKLEELDRLEELAKDTTEPAWRPSGVPEQDVSGVLLPYYRGQEEYLRRELRQLQRENASLAQRVQAGRDAIRHTELRIVSSVDQWKASVGDLEAFAASLCPSENFDHL